MNLYAKQKQIQRHRKQIYGYQRGKGWVEINQKGGINLSTNKGLIMYSTGVYTQYFVITFVIICKGKESEKEHTHTHTHIVKAIFFPVVMYRCESQTIKKAEHRRTDVFNLWCWRRLLRVRWTARRSIQSILKESSPEYSLEGPDDEAETPILWPPDVKN